MREGLAPIFCKIVIFRTWNGSPCGARATFASYHQGMSQRNEAKAFEDHALAS